MDQAEQVLLRRSGEAGREGTCRGLDRRPGVLKGRGRWNESSALEPSPDFLLPSPSLPTLLDRQQHTYGAPLSVRTLSRMNSSSSSFRQRGRALQAQLPTHLPLKIANTLTYWSLVAFHLYNTVRGPSKLSGEDAVLTRCCCLSGSSSTSRLRPQRRRTSRQASTLTGSGQSQPGCRSSPELAAETDVLRTGF